MSNPTNRELITAKARIMVLESAIKRVILFHKTHSEIEPADYAAIIGGEIMVLEDLFNE